MSKGRDEISVVELFAGVGGFRCGLESASERFKTVWANQWEPGRKTQYAFDCYVSHFGESKTHVNEDIGLVKDKIPKHDLLVGGFPCQDYSVARTQARGIEGKKGVLWWHIKDIIEAKRPKYVLLENVDRLIRSPANQRGRDFAIMLRSLCDLGYAVEWRVINAAQYGEAQRRRRVFIFAFKESTPLYKSTLGIGMPFEVLIDKKGFFAKPFPVTKFERKQSSIDDFKENPPQSKSVWCKSESFSIGPKEYESLVELSDKFERRFYASGVAVKNLVYTREGSPIYSGKYKTLSSIMLDSTDSKYEVDQIDKWRYMKGAKSEPRINKKNGIKYKYAEGKMAFPDDINKPGRTMLTSEGKMNRSTHVVKDKATGKCRLLTPVECERLNGFPDGWTEGMPESFRYFTMGNALVVPLVEKMGKRLVELIDQSDLKA